MSSVRLFVHVLTLLAVGGGIVMGVHARSPEDAAYLEQEWKNYRGEQVFR